MTPRLSAHVRHNTVTPEQAVEIEKSGYDAIWLVGSPPADLEIAEKVLDATDHVTVATGIVNVWTADVRTVAESYHRIAGKHPGRFLLGIGAGHPEVDTDYASPYDKVVAYLDALDEADVPADRIVLAALGPKMLRLARDRTAGTVPVMVTPDHTRLARAILGPDSLLLPGHQVLLDTDAERARAVGRATVGIPALHVSNYTANLRRIGFTDEDLTEPGSDRLIDALLLHGDAETVATGLKAHLEAGADEVGVTAHGDDETGALRTVAEAVRGLAT